MKYNEMKNESLLVVKDNALIEASFNLSLTEQRMILLGIVSAREQFELTPDTPIEIKVSDFIKQYDVDKKSAYRQLADATKTLFSRQFSFMDRYKDSDSVTVSRWVNEVKYVKDKGMVVMYLNRNVIKMITRLESHFTKYHLEQVSNLTSQYSIRLFELISQWLSNNETKKYEIEELRLLLGVEPHEYKTMSNFKPRVLDNAVNEINAKTELKLSYEQFKSGRVITHIQFKIKQPKKSIGSKSKEPSLKSLTGKQIEMFSDKLSKLTEFQNHFVAPVGASSETYRQEIALKLKDSFYVKEWIDFLKIVGFN